MSYLLDTVVLSALRRPDRHADVVRWIRGRAESELFISVVTLGEIERGISRQRGHDPIFAQALKLWLDQVLTLYGDRVLPVTTAIARRWGLLSGETGRDDIDLLIAATAQAHGLIVATRNVKHFERCDVATLNPFGPP